jgi:probable rRNA maturation factor
MQIDLVNETSFEVNINKLENILKNLTEQEIELLVLNNSQIQEINHEFRQINKPTDVLSFPYESMPGAPLGSITISIDFVEEKAKEYGHNVEDEFLLLFIHGLLHLLGFDHEVDSGEHRQKEEELIKKYNLPNSLIVRNS